jgi:transposase
LAKAGKAIVIPSKANRRIPREYDRDLHEARHLIHNFLLEIRQFRAIAARQDRTARNFAAAVHLTASVIWLNRRHAPILRCARR